MKEKIAKWLVSIAKRLNPITQTDYKVVENYEQKKLGLTFVITKKDIKEYRFKDGARMSLREGKRMIVNETRKKIRQHIISGIDGYRLIEYEVEPKDGGFLVTGFLNVCAKDDGSKAEN